MRSVHHEEISDMPRDSDFREAYIEDARERAEAGATIAELADHFGCSMPTLYAWGKKDKRFLVALKAGREHADERVEATLFQKAVGYSRTEVTELPDGSTKTVTTHYPADTTSGIFWLKNRKPNEWRDRQEQDHTGTVAVVVTGGLPKDV
jgi:hypothetical protein